MELVFGAIVTMEERYFGLDRSSDPLTVRETSCASEVLDLENLWTPQCHGRYDGILGVAELLLPAECLSIYYSLRRDQVFDFSPVGTDESGIWCG